MSKQPQDDPAIHLGPLKIWFFGRQFPQAEDYWDANWLNGTAIVVGNGSSIRLTGSFIHLGELEGWRDSLKSFQTSLQGTAELPTIEPNLSVKIVPDGSKTGHLKCEVGITADHLSEKHQYLFEIDQSYLPGLITEISAVLREYPVKNAPKEMK